MSLFDDIRQRCTPLQPEPTGVEPVLRDLGRIRAVLFDIYGTLVISAASDPTAATIERIAVVYECRVNPVWAMPGAADLLGKLRERGLAQGIISNAQFYTPLLFPVLLDADLGRLGVSADLCWFSYAHGHGKPDFWLYHHAAAALRHHGVAPHQALYVGNDMRNDIWPAAELGFRTALFAGDARSLRWREDHPQAARVTPDLIVTELAQIADCLA
ncbi:MAG: HAD family hydrolase [Planctomycetota bacterium]